MASSSSSSARLTATSLFCCGDNGYGQLGLGDNNRRNTFTAVLFFGPVHPDLILCCSLMATHTFAVSRNDDPDGRLPTRGPRVQDPQGSV